MLAFLRLIRLPNLLIIAFTQCLIQFCLIEPILKLSHFNLQMSSMEFFLFVLATVFIAAGGYIINDYFDVRIDTINKPDHLVIDHGIKRRVAMGAHAVLSILGVMIGIFLSWKCNILLAGSTLFIFSVIGLWFYSTSFKYQFLTGNIIISLLTAMVPFMVALFEVPRIILTYNNQLFEQQSKYGFAATTTILLWAGAYGVFAFILSLIREILKDMEDVEGDLEYGCKTIPIVAGITKTKTLLSALVILVITGTGYCQRYLQEQFHNGYVFLYIFLFVQIPLLLLLYKIFRAREKKQFHSASVIVKLIMLAGVCFLLVFRFFLLK